jgi:AcrR family transcriptional regulator
MVLGSVMVHSILLVGNIDVNLYHMNARAYDMTSRADEAQRTGDRIVDAMLQRFARLPFGQIRLEDVAADAGVTVQTVIRRFGNKAGLLVATVERELGRIAASRSAIAGASARETVEALGDHYEIYGALILKTYAEADLVDGMVELAKRGREYHVSWCRSAFAVDSPPGAAGSAQRERRLAQIVAVCDARTWSILRLESGLSAEQTTLALLEMLMPLIADERAAVPTGSAPA